MGSGNRTRREDVRVRESIAMKNWKQQNPTHPHFDALQTRQEIGCPIRLSLSASWSEVWFIFHSQKASISVPCGVGVGTDWHLVGEWMSERERTRVGSVGKNVYGWVIVQITSGYLLYLGQFWRFVGMFEILKLSWKYSVQAYWSISYLKV